MRYSGLGAGAVLLVLAAVLLGAAGCGYYNPYVVNDTGRAITLHRAMWENRTSELALESVFYRSLSSYLRKTPKIILKDSNEDAEFGLTGTIESVDYPELSYTTNREASELRAKVRITVTIVRNSTGEVVWEKKNYMGTETIESFAMSDDPGVLQRNKDEALRKISDDVAEMIYLTIIKKIIAAEQK